MNDFVQSCTAAATYPKNLVSHREYQHTLDNYVKLLNERDNHLFGPERNAILDFWDLVDGAANFRFNQTKAEHLENHLHFPPSAPQTWAPQLDPICRYMFMHAPNARDRLLATRKMLVTMASYHQIMAPFLDFLFSFGKQHHAKDFFFTGFHHDTRLSDFERSATISALGRSGCAIQLCYSLRSVEASPSQENWPWSVRGTATHHTFDLETGRANWLMVKGRGGTSMKERIVTETSLQTGLTSNKYDSNSQRFGSTLSTHLLLCNWSAENWRWYINYMEEEVQATTLPTLSVTVSKPQTESSSNPTFTRKATGLLTKAPTHKSVPTKPQSAIAMVPIPAKPTSPGPPGTQGGPPSLSTVAKAPNFGPSKAGSKFSFDDLQKIEYIEEKANQANLVITLNEKVIKALVKHYDSVMESSHFPDVIRQECSSEYRRFSERILDICTDVQSQKARVETLLRLLADRKTLLYGILEYQNIEASKELSSKSQYSADHVEYMTQQMKQEAVFMRIITLVTLFFLPGTFVSTLMSTDMFQWQSIRGFFALTIPFMVLTFSAAYGFYRWSKWNDVKGHSRQADDMA